MDALTDEEFEHALHSIDRYFKMNESQQTAWGLLPRRGPQSSAERHDPTKLNYLGAPRRYQYFSRLIFDRELQAIRDAASLDDVTEEEFQMALHRTAAVAVNHQVTRSYGTPFAGPQSLFQRHDAALMQMEPGPRAGGHAGSTPEFLWLQCDACDRQRRVDQATFDLFHNATWNADAKARRRQDLLEAHPTLERRLRTWLVDRHGAQQEDDDGTAQEGPVSIDDALAYLERCDLRSGVVDDHERAWVELLEQLCVETAVRVEPAVHDALCTFAADDKGPTFTLSLIHI